MVWYGLISWLSNQPALPGPESEIGQFVWFNLAHFLVYAILTFLVWLAWANTLRFPRRVFRGWLTTWGLATMVLVALLAGADEWHQSYVVGRDATLSDFFVDMLSATVVVSSLRHYNQAHPLLIRIWDQLSRKTSR